MGGLASPALVPQPGGGSPLNPRRGKPGDLEARLDRVSEVEHTPATAAPLGFLAAVLAHQQERVAAQQVRKGAALLSAQAVANRLVERFPLLDLGAATETVMNELAPAIAALAKAAPAALAGAGEDLAGRDGEEQRELIETWWDDPSLLDPRMAAWVQVSAGPILESAAASLPELSKEEWSGPACPACGGAPQVSVIREESGEFMAGSPRYLICGRCALWWSFGRATCPSCGEDDSRKVGAFSPEGERWVRIDACDTCLAYTKTFDLREAGAKDVVPLVDDVATLTLDVWAHEKGLHRSGLSLAGV